MPVSDVDKYRSNITEVLEKMKEHWPQYELDGTQNIWIVKPGAKSRGRGLKFLDLLFSALV